MFLYKPKLITSYGHGALHYIFENVNSVNTYLSIKTCIFPVTAGIADEGFEMLEQLAYLYLANNKVSHAVDLKSVSNKIRKSVWKYFPLNFSLYVSSCW